MGAGLKNCLRRDKGEIITLPSLLKYVYWGGNMVATTIGGWKYVVMWGETKRG